MRCVHLGFAVWRPTLTMATRIHVIVMTGAARESTIIEPG
jgi:hypothetical protein